MSTSDTSIVDDFLSWLRSLSNRIESHETRITEQATTISALNSYTSDSLNAHTARLDAISKTQRTDGETLNLLVSRNAEHKSGIEGLNVKVDDLARSTAEHFNGLDTDLITSFSNIKRDIDVLKATVAEIKAGQQGPTPVDPNPIPDPVPGPIDPVDPDPVIPYTSAVTIDVKNYSHAPAPAGSYVTVAVPIPKSANALDHDEFSLADGAVIDPLPDEFFRSNLIPCDVRVTARWGSPVGPAVRPIRWVNVTFQTIRPISPSAPDQYTLLIGTTEPTPSEQIDVIQLPYKDGYDVLTGPTQFRIKATGIEGILDDDPVSALTSAGTVARLSPTTEDKIVDCATLTPRRLEVEYWGPLTAIIVQESMLNGQNVIPGPVSVRRRYQFYANSSTVHVTQTLTWEGAHPDAGGNVKRPDNTWNALLGTLFRESFSLPMSSKAATTVTVLDRASSSTGAAIPFKDSSGKRVTLTQHLRDRRINLSSTGKKELNQTRYSLTVGDTPDTYTTHLSGPDADGGLLSISAPTSSVTVALRHMHRYEPQSISFDPSTSTLNLDLASDRFRLAHHQSLFVEYSITVLPRIEGAEPDLLSMWRDLNTPLIGLVSPEWVNASQATWNRIPTYFGQIASDERVAIREGYAKSVRAIIDSTLRKRTSEGTQGLLTWGLYPQYWGEWNDFSPDGLGSGLKSWDQTYLEATFTDYWNTARLAVEGAISLSRPEWVNEITLPAALRMLHTQIVQGPPSLSLDRVGQESIGTAHYGYGLYRSDKNSSHQYFENLWWYYYLTGDYTVVEKVERGARVLLRRFKSGSPVAGREPMQWMSVFLFLDGVSTSTDIDWGKEFDALMTRSIQEHYLQGLTSTGEYEAVWIDDRTKLTDTNTTSLYSFGYYDAEMINALRIRTNNAAIHLNPAHPPSPQNTVTPSGVLVSLARTICTAGFTLVSSTPGDVASNWARIFRVTYDRSISRFTAFSAGTKDGDPYLYPDDKPALAAFLARAARLSRDPIIITTARNLLAYSFSAILGKGVATGVQVARLRDIPMGKLMGLCAGRLGTAVMEMMKLEEELNK